jgi:hypothetical protein
MQAGAGDLCAAEPCWYSPERHCADGQQGGAAAARTLPAGPSAWAAKSPAFGVPLQNRLSGTALMLPLASVSPPLDTKDPLKTNHDEFGLRPEPVRVPQHPRSFGEPLQG